MRKNVFLCLIIAIILLSCNAKSSSKKGTEAQKPFRALVLSESGGHHVPFSKAGLKWLEEMAAQHNFTFTSVHNTRSMTDDELAKYDLIIQLDYVPYSWTDAEKAAFEKYIDEGRGGWVGFHHATLLGNFDGYPMWKWFSGFMGGIEYRNYIAELADGTVVVEDKKHPVMKNVNPSFVVPDDEWYIFDRSPRPNVRVLATVDESTYEPDSDIKMGDHPVVWINENKKARNVYFLMGHSPVLFDSDDFKTMFINAILWTAGRN